MEKDSLPMSMDYDVLIIGEEPPERMRLFWRPELA
jgi:hypothetical protein